jgi:hypothetical protein
MAEKSQSLSDDALAREVDRLLRKLPGADPYLRGDPEPAKAEPVRTPAGGVPRVGPARRVRPTGPSRVQRIGVWVRVFLGAILAVLITQWPYSSGCGLGLSFYLIAVLAVLVAGTWAGVWSWRYRMGLAHAASITMIYWGVVLMSHEILQRNGYALVSATWRCGGG